MNDLVEAFWQEWRKGMSESDSKGVDLRDEDAPEILREFLDWVERYYELTPKG